MREFVGEFELEVESPQRSVKVQLAVPDSKSSENSTIWASHKTDASNSMETRTLLRGANSLVFIREEYLWLTQM